MLQLYTTFTLHPRRRERGEQKAENKLKNVNRPTQQITNPPSSALLAVLYFEINLFLKAYQREWERRKLSTFSWNAKWVKVEVWKPKTGENSHTREFQHCIQMLFNSLSAFCTPMISAESSFQLSTRVRTAVDSKRLTNIDEISVVKTTNWCWNEIKQNSWNTTSFQLLPDSPQWLEYTAAEKSSSD